MSLAIPAFESARVLVAGDVMLDRYWSGPVSRISPEAPVPVVRITEIEERPGGAGNVALNVAALGAWVTVLGIVGDDAPGEVLQRHLSAAGVNCVFERRADRPTVTKLRVLSRHQQLIRLDFEVDFASVDTAHLRASFAQQLVQAGAVVLSDYGKGTLHQARALIDLARAAGKPVLVDPKGRDFSIYRGATLITPNLSEFEAVVGPCRDERDLIDKGRALLRQQELGALLITRSEHGMTLLREGCAELHLPAQAREVYDVTGAGDTVIATVAAVLAAGHALEDAAVFANHAAGIVVGKLGAATVSVPELRSAVLGEAHTGRGELSEEQLLIAVQTARAAGARIVMTNGCFDILHAGHVAYLEQARRLGDRLIIAVNDDASVARLKGAGRPVNTLARRMAVLAGLSAVDWVVPFSEDTPERLICAVLPDLLIKGGDYRPEQIAGYDCVTGNGGKVVVLNYEEGCSTTEVIARIRELEE